MMITMTLLETVRLVMSLFFTMLSYISKDLFSFLHAEYCHFKTEKFINVICASRSCEKKRIFQWVPTCLRPIFVKLNFSYGYYILVF